MELHGVSGARRLCNLILKRPPHTMLAATASSQYTDATSPQRVCSVGSRLHVPVQIQQALPDSNHEYLEWILTYASEEYLELPAKHEHLIDTLGPAQPYGAHRRASPFLQAQCFLGARQRRSTLPGERRSANDAAKDLEPTQRMRPH